MMFTSQLVTLLALACASPATAFSPTASSITFVSSSLTARTITTSVPSANNINNHYNTALHLSDNTADNFDKQLDKIKDNADDVLPKFLVVDINRARDDLAKNWGWITASGIATMALGVASFTAPIFATGVAYDATVLTVAFTGAVGLVNLFVAEQGQKLKYGLSGALYLALAYYMSTNPVAGLDVITFSIATVLAGEGLFETSMAIKNKSLDGRPWHFVSGLISILVSSALVFNLPVSGLFTPGAALGTRLTTSGARKVAVGLTGKEIADSQK